MKRGIFFLMLLVSVFANAQQLYKTEPDISYYNNDVAAKNTYIASQCKLDIYYPTNVKDFATIVWFHGGSLTGGQKQIPKALTNKGYAVVGVEYRLSPKATAPAYIEDAAAAVAWVFKNVAKYGGNTKLIFVSGHSAGGYLAMMITLDKSYLKKYEIDANNIAGIIPFSGQAITHFTIRKELGIKNTQPIIDKYAPLFFVREDAPKMLLITGDRELELLGRYEENAYLLRMMKLTGNKHTTLYELQGFDHGGMAEPAYPLLLKEVAASTKQILNH
ncbi:MAG: alpha/beta hydrolase [Flavobacterium sp.]|nr:alpha/beta hydrolase [Flavobacterium sp.]